MPPDNPFVKDKAYLPEIYTLGHRNPLGLYFRANGELWSTEEGPQGGDELNLIKAGKNYGWPEVSLGRNYDGTSAPKGFTAPGFEEPVVYWVPAIANSGLSWYNGDKFPAWKDQAFIGGMRNNTGQYIVRVTFNEKGLPTGRENMLADLRQRIREVKPGPDGLIYVLTDTNPGHILRIEPIEGGQAPAGGGLAVVVAVAAAGPPGSIATVEAGLKTRLYVSTSTTKAPSRAPLLFSGYLPPPAGALRRRRSGSNSTTASTNAAAVTPSNAAADAATPNSIR